MKPFAKLRILACVLAIACVCSGCSQSDLQGEAPDSAAGASVPAEDGGAINYSKHIDPDEAQYRTVLADPSALKEGKPVLATKEPAARWSKEPLMEFSNKDDIWGYDIRSQDVSKADFGPIQDYNALSFNTDTKWPSQLPQGLDPNQILEFNKNPGLGIRALHEKGIVGSGVGVAIIDQLLLCDHEQYKENLMYYERVHCIGEEANMHGPAVASMAVGKDIGVAPGAKLYYIASTFGHFGKDDYEFDASIIADCILRVLEINENLAESEKIKVISISKGYRKSDKGYKELTAAIEKADAENIFVITTSTDEYYKDFALFGMNRNYEDDPDDMQSYLPAGWITEDFYANPSQYQNSILVPMGSRTYAGWTGTSDYEIGHEGGMSWAVPWCAGFYALCCQVKPDITPQEFIEVVKSTSRTIQITKDNQQYPLGQIIDPAAVINALTTN